MRRRGVAGLAPAATALALALTGCGSSSVSAVQLRTGAKRACARADARLDVIPTPKAPADGRAFISRGIAALEPELTALARLHAPGELAKPYEHARTATADEVRTLRSTLNGLKAGNDPVVAIKTLQQELIPLERRAATGWAAVGIPACANS